MNIIKCNVIPIENLRKGITNVCRLCLDAKSIMKSLYNPLEEIFEEGVTTLFHIMQKLSKTKLSDDPKYPSYICLNCIALLNTAYKVNRLMEMSQTQMNAYFNDQTSLTKIDKVKYCAVDNVEIISNKGKYSLRDILIVEDDNKTQSTFNGFLNNLGSEVSAGFVDRNYKKKLKEDKFHIVNVIPVKESTNIQSQATQSNQSSNLSEADCSKLLRIVENTKNKTTHKTTLVLKKNMIRKQKTDCVKMKTKMKKTYLCQLCGHIANGANSLSNHMKLEHNGSRFTCEVCGKKYLSNSHLGYHMLKHKNERKYLCTVCGKNFNYSSSLEYHMRIHTGEKKYKCTYCDRGFTMQCGLKRHLRTHTGLRPYNCSFCDKAFCSKGEVACHEMTHTGFRPYHCEYCGKGFTKSYNKKMHILGHSGSFFCKFCQRGFVTNSYLKFHMKIAHRLNDIDVNDDDDAYILESDDIDVQLGETLNAIE